MWPCPVPACRGLGPGSGTAQLVTRDLTTSTSLISAIPGTIQDAPPAGSTSTGVAPQAVLGSGVVLFSMMCRLHRSECSAARALVSCAIHSV